MYPLLPAVIQPSMMNDAGNHGDDGYDDDATIGAKTKTSRRGLLLNCDELRTMLEYVFG